MNFPKLPKPPSPALQRFWAKIDASITVGGRPGPMAAGVHTVRVQAQDYAGNAAEKTWAFRVELPGGPPPSQPLSVELQVLSKHVKPHKSERAEVKITSNTSPTSYLIQVKRQGQVVYQTQVSGQTGPYLFVWNGLTNNGQQASNGDHEVLITATDSFGRTATQTVQVVVNFQGK